MKELNKNTVKHYKQNPVKIVQFGEGNFLRAFIDWIFDNLNESENFNGSVTIIQPIEQGLTDIINHQNGLYHVFIKGLVNNEVVEDIRLIKSVNKCINPYIDYADYEQLATQESIEYIISNTTEAGIEYVDEKLIPNEIAKSYPGKLTQFLYKRFQHFNGDKNKGLTILPCELINNNADELKKCIYKYIDVWNLGTDFKQWIEKATSFHNTLVDRIVTGYPKDNIQEYQEKIGYKDNLIVTAEHYHLWVIEGKNDNKLNQLFKNSNLNVLLVDKLQPYRTRKVRILNGAHTSMVPVGLLNGNTTVQQTVEQTFTKDFVQSVIFNEICPILDFPEKEITEYANEIINRFKNPAIAHQLSSIALNSISKFKVRVLPSIIDYYNKFNKLPVNLSFAFAALIVFYKGNGMPVNDDKETINIFTNLWEKHNINNLVKKVLENKAFWDKDLNSIDGLAEAMSKAVGLIEDKGVEKAWKEFCKYNNH